MPAVAWGMAAPTINGSDLIYAVIEDYVFFVTPGAGVNNAVFRSEPEEGAHKWAVERTAIMEAGGCTLLGEPVEFQPSASALAEIARMVTGAWNIAPVFHRRYR